MTYNFGFKKIFYFFLIGKLRQGHEYIEGTRGGLKKEQNEVRN